MGKYYCAGFYRTKYILRNVINIRLYLDIFDSFDDVITNLFVNYLSCRRTLKFNMMIISNYRLAYRINFAALRPVP